MNKVINWFADWQDRRSLWLLMAFTGFILEQVAYQIFQKWLYMNPCEQCVYIRFSMFCLVIGGIIAAISPKQIVLKLVGYVIGFYGIIMGIGFSVKLNAIHKAVHSDDPFGVQGCSAVPTFPFNLPLHKWMPDTFLPTGDCGYDNPIIPDGAVLSNMQQILTDFYSEGWYLIPSQHFMNMAQAMLLCFVVCLLLLGVCFASWIIRLVRERRPKTV